MLRGHYGARSAAMMVALEKHMPEGTRWTRPDGGMFAWVALPGGLVADELFAEALREKVAFVPGTSFSPRAAAQLHAPQLLEPLAGSSTRA